MKRDFCIGSEWLYYKIYTGVKTADVILIENLYPIIQELKTENRLQKWFFIRYKDPDEHIRVRFYCENIENTSIIISKFYPVLQMLLQENTIWKVQTDTYQRELERYGKKTIEESETLFWQDSEMMLNYLSLKSSFIKNEIELIFSFLSIDSFLNSFSINNIHKLTLMDELQASFKKEFDADKTLKKEMNKHYRELSQEAHYFLYKTASEDYSKIYELIQEKQKQSIKAILSIKGKLTIPLLEFLKSHIHMMINRQYSSKQRIYELLIYDHLFRYYKNIEYFKK
ncbi:MAG TPA: thiopeptide-type bacteriocin biosynthesis protein [Flavobacterium sp.]|uniref:thiopeptide-type bacteriocin biosynthesis protein n=1 Tax=Flavobacterium sp. TaxID=239 RepID=UPI002DB85AF2|nr:thiopeptide-type bacteriocin biosynthesis protein [Flavobacterium sp.]HEU4788849.1 thiopeptide-type bacteriocin biosynthesis protein [Flavobacterium sp.]